MSTISRVTLIAATTATAGVLGIAGPAIAETVTTPDALNDMRHRADIQSVRIAHSADAVRVTIWHKDLAPDGLAGAKMYFDIDPDRPGPEYVLLAGLFDGTDYGLFRARRDWGIKGTPVSRCDYTLRLRYARETSVVTADPACFGDPSKVRVGLRLSADTAHGTKVDWLSGRRTLSDWAVRG